MFKRTIKQSDLLVIAANLVPVFGVWFLGWSPVEAFIVYALETLLVGMLTLLKLTVVTIYRKKDTWSNEGVSKQVSGVFFILFFTLHYGLFAAVQTSIFSQCAGITPPRSGLMHFFFHWYAYVNRDIAYMLAAFVISYLVKSFLPFIVNSEYKRVSMMELMFQPYGRIFIQQVTVIMGSMFLQFGIGKAFILVFAVVKIIFEVFTDFNALLQKSMIKMQQRSAKK